MEIQRGSTVRQPDAKFNTTQFTSKKCTSKRLSFGYQPNFKSIKRCNGTFNVSPILYTEKRNGFSEKIQMDLCTLWQVLNRLFI